MNNWTDDQLQAIQSRGGTLLVEAAAGSGKTAVLVERIIRRVIDEKIDINRFLVVTFTNMAAQEMKEKIIDAVAREISKQPENIFLRKQISLVHKAQITTVHSFCFNIIRENFNELKLAPDFKIASQIDINAMIKECMNNVILDFFSNIDEDFKKLVDILGQNKIENEMIEIYKFIQSNVSPIAFLDGVCKKYANIEENGFENSEWFEIICENARKKAEDCLELSNEALKMCDLDSLLKINNEEKLQNENIEIYNLCQALIAENWDNAHEIATNFNYAKWKSCTKSENLDLVNFAKKARDKYKEEIEKISELLYLPLEKVNEQSNELAKIMFCIRDILAKFDEEFKEEKRRKNVLDFSDAEHKTVELLMNIETGAKKEIAYEISNKFTEIMVDEYQDTNEIQDILFKLLSKNEKNIFMVGDVKQSIYKFRLADPMIFLRKSKEFVSVKDAENDEPRRVALSKNFRSRNEILEAVNFIFENIMTTEASEIVYDDDQILKLGASYTKYDQAKTEFCLVDFDKFDGEKTVKHSENDEDFEGETEDETTREVEAKVIACKIVELITQKYQVYDGGVNSRDANLSDIVILLRSKSYANIYKKALENCGINVDYKEGAKQLLGMPEVSNFISLFKILDNYLLDIELIAVMKSPIFCFSDEEIAKMRINNMNISIYECAEKSENPKALNFVEKVREIHEYSQNNTIFRTLWFVIHEFDLLAKYALMNNGEMRRSNILRFLDFVNTVDNDFSVYDFVNFIEKMESEEAILPSGIKNGHKVRIITMHSSKGLEFPIVFLADTAKNINTMDLKKPVLLHNELGIGLNYDDDVMSYHSLMKKAIQIKKNEELIAEEMRVLYVAMTRAKEKMFVMCTIKNAEKTYEKWLEGIDFLANKSYHFWFGANIVKLPSSKIFYEKFGISGQDVKIDHTLKNYFECKYIIDYSQEKIFGQNDEMKTDYEIIDLEYEHINSTTIPSKITATSIDVGQKDVEIQRKVMKKPKFMLEKKISATEKGIAHHIVMQFIKFENCLSVGEIEQEILRLYNEKFITKIQAEAINPQKIYAFINSETGKKLINSQEIIREFKFSILVKACEILDTESEDEVLLQGVIDCMFVQNDEIVLIDYKTDNVNERNIDEISMEHKKQLAIYAKAIEEIFKKKVSQIYLYYFKTESFYKL